MEPQGSLPCSEEPATGPYTEPDSSTPQLSIHFFRINSNAILQSTPRSSKWSLTFSFPEQNYVCVISPCVLHVSRILFSLILSL